jgi:SpoVK/Ycf46/Vps4 family AAA+-type ATPase
MIWDLFKPEAARQKSLVEWVTPRKTFDDVILPARTRKQLRDALTQIDKHHLIFEQWGLGDRHHTGTGLGFNFAGPPGTGKTLCAEALAQALDRPLALVRYAQMESMWAGESGKNVVQAFREARERNAVLFFDEADAIASRRVTNMYSGYEREANQVINILLRELEEYEGVCIFATNLATNFDPAFERRIRTHIYFELPGPAERALIWQAQLSRRTPLADDVDFEDLGVRFEMSGGDIKNAVLKAAQMAAGEEGRDADKRICQRHFEAAAEEVLDAKRVMQQSLFDDDANGLPEYGAQAGALARFGALEEAVATDRNAIIELQTAHNNTTEALKQMNAAWQERWEKMAAHLARGTFLPVPPWVVGGTFLALVAGLIAALVTR